ncbi:MAG TPA: IS701 family transposase [Solirubrobacteraceae bacterium]|nr:IS701 family transposase [Solirubrobacteraceae bacterium]
MTPQQIRKLERELGEYVAQLTDGMGRPERREAMGLYLKGLLLDGERKSIEPIAARLVDDLGEVEGMRQRLLQCVAVSKWAEVEVFRRIAVKVDAELPAVEALVIDDTGFPKKGEHSVGVTRQYSGTLGRIENCQVATSLHLAGEKGSACIGLRLYLPEEWTNDRRRCRKAGVPDEVAFHSKWELALELLDNALIAGVRARIVLADSGYGDTREFRNAIRERGLDYAVGVHHPTRVWRPGTMFSVPPKTARKGPPRRNAHAAEGAAVSIGELAKELTYRTVTWREGTRGKQSSRFAAARVRTSHKHTQGAAPGPEEWLLCEWPSTESAPSKHYLLSLPAPPPSASWCGRQNFAGASNATTKTSRGRWGSTTSRGGHGPASIITPRSAPRPTPSLRSAERFPPRSRLKWTLPMVRRHLQAVLLRSLPTCPLCRRAFDPRHAPHGVSRM